MDSFEKILLSRNDIKLKLNECRSVTSGLTFFFFSFFFQTMGDLSAEPPAETSAIPDGVHSRNSAP